MSADDQHCYEFGGFYLDPAEHLLLRNGEPVALTPKTFETLVILVRNNGHLLSKDELMREVWADTFVEENNLEKIISALRKTLGKNERSESYIETVRRRGYRFSGDVSYAEPQRSRAETVEKVHSSIDLLQADGPIASDQVSGDHQLNGQSIGKGWLAFLCAAALVIGMVGIGYYFLSGRMVPSADGRRSLAVLPFINVGQDQNAQYLSDGITESIVNNLSQLTSLKVMSINSAYRFRNDQSDAKMIASELGVETLVTGDIKQIGDKVVINVRLIDPSDGSQIWGSQYVKSPADIIATQNEIAQAVAQNLRLKLTGAEKRQLDKRATDNPEAYQLYLRGRFHIFKLTQTEINQGILDLQQAIAIDPNYALAYVGLSDAYRSLALATETNPAENLLKSRTAANKAIEIDPTLSEGYTVLGASNFWLLDWNDIETTFKRSLELNPNDVSGHLIYAHFLSNTGRHAEALSEVKLARELDPLFPFVGALEGQFLLHAGKTDEALTRLQKTLELSPNFWMPHAFASSVYIEKGMFAEALVEARKATELSPAQTWSVALEGYVLARSGRQAEARGVLNKLLELSKERFVPPTHVALIYNALGETDRALEYLQKGYDEHDPKMIFLKVEPKWNNLRSEPRFIELMRRTNF